MAPVLRPAQPELALLDEPQKRCACGAIVLIAAASETNGPRVHTRRKEIPPSGLHKVIFEGRIALWQPGSLRPECLEPVLATLVGSGKYSEQLGMRLLSFRLIPARTVLLSLVFLVSRHCLAFSATRRWPRGVRDKERANRVATYLSCPPGRHMS